MKRGWIVPAAVILLVLSIGCDRDGFRAESGTLVQSAEVPASAAGLIHTRDIDPVVRVPEAEVTGFFMKNREAFSELSFYLTMRQTLPNGRLTLTSGDAALFSKITDPDKAAVARRLLDDGPFEFLTARYESHLDSAGYRQSAGGDTPETASSDASPFARTIWMVDSEFGVFEQTLQYVSDPAVIEQAVFSEYGKMILSQTCHYRNLGDGWFYCVKLTHEVKNAGRYRDALLDYLSGKDTDARAYFEQPVRNALVTVKDWGPDHGHRTVISILVHHDSDLEALTGPMIQYLDPESAEVLGGEAFD